MPEINIIFKTGISITLNCVDYSFDENTNNHTVTIHSNEVASIQEVEENKDTEGVLID